MASVFYPSLDVAEVIDLELLTLDGDIRTLRLLVDSGFMGKSSLVLPNTAAGLIRAALPAANTTGALQGLKDRGWVTCRIAELNYQETVIAIVTDTTSLSLPPGVEGLAGLTFLRQFASWGSQRTTSGWQFFLSDGRD
jgi:hypothetical protein